MLFKKKTFENWVFYLNVKKNYPFNLLHNALMLIIEQQSN